MHPNEIPLVRRASTNPKLLVPSPVFERIRLASLDMSFGHAEAFHDQVARQMDTLRAEPTQQAA